MSEKLEIIMAKIEDIKSTNVNDNVAHHVVKRSTEKIDIEWQNRKHEITFFHSSLACNINAQLFQIPQQQLHFAIGQASEYLQCQKMDQQSVSGFQQDMDLWPILLIT